MAARTATPLLTTTLAIAAATAAILVGCTRHPQAASGPPASPGVGVAYHSTSGAPSSPATPQPR